MDWELLKHYSKMFDEQNGVDPLTSQKARLRMLESIEK